MINNKPILVPDSYVSQVTTRGLLIHYIAPCGERHFVGIVHREEFESESPAVSLAYPTIGIKGLIKIARLLEDWVKSREKH